MSNAKLSKKEQYVQNKKDANEKIREKRRAIASKLGGTDEPSIDAFDYKVSLMQALNYYNVNGDYKKYRQWLNDYLLETNRKKLITTLNKVDDFQVRSLGILCRLKSRNEFLEQSELNFIDNKLEELLDEANAIQDAKPVKIIKVSKKETVDPVQEETIAVFDEAIDTFIQDNKMLLDPVAYLKTNEIPASVSKKVVEYYTKILNELKQVISGNDEQLVEGYSNFSKLKMKKYVALVESFIASCSQQVVSAKVRKPRKPRTVSPDKVVSKLRYMKEFVELGLKSIKPTNMIGSSEIWVYNTKSKKITVYRSVKDGKLSIHRSNITNYDVATSVTLSLRKPMEFFKDTTIAKRALGAALKLLTTKPSAPSGRINEDTIILGSF